MLLLRHLLDEVVSASFVYRGKRFKQLPDGRGIGLACSSYLCGAGLPIYWNKMPHSGVQLKLDRSGGVTVFCGCTEIGQGSDDVLVGLVAEVLGIDPFDIRCVTADTDLTPVDLGSYSSRVTLMMGNAAIQAAERARDQVGSAVAARLDVPAERLVFAGGRVCDARDAKKGMDWRDAVICAEETHGTIGSVGSYSPPRSTERARDQRQRTPVGDLAQGGLYALRGQQREIGQRFARGERVLPEAHVCEQQQWTESFISIVVRRRNVGLH